MDRAGVLTYIFLHTGHDLAFSGVSALWVCLCRDRLELEAKCLPHSAHWYLDLENTLTSISGREMSEEAGETGGGEAAGEYTDDLGDDMGDEAEENTEPAGEDMARGPWPTGE